jgi:DNA-binding NtrC family response regulator
MAVRSAKQARVEVAQRSAEREMLLLAITESRAFPFALLPGVQVLVGRAPNADLKLSDSKVAPLHLLLRPLRGEILEVEDLSGDGTLLNEVQLSGTSIAHVGDQISVGDSVLLILRAPSPSVRQPRLIPAAEFDDRLQAESERGRQFRRPFSVLLLRSPAVRTGSREELLGRLMPHLGPACAWSEFGPQVRALLCPEVAAQECATLRGTLAGALGEEGHRFSIGYASFPDDGVDADSILEAALLRLSGQDPNRSPCVDEAVFLDPVMVRLLPLIDRLARSEAAVLFLGERGVGKQMLARALHQRSARSTKPLVRLSGASLWGASAESALFGAPGAIEAAAGGTLLIDAITLLPLSLQARLAHALEVRGTAPSSPAPSDPRIVATSEDDVGLRARSGLFRADLFERLSSMMVTIPALRDRPAEILPLADLFLSRARKMQGRPRLFLGGEARTLLQHYGWPGNVRELKNAIDRAGLASETDQIHPGALPPALLQSTRNHNGAVGAVDLRSSLKVAERDALLKALAGTSWNVTQAAKYLGLPRRTVVYRMSRLGLRRPAR